MTDSEALKMVIQVVIAILTPFIAVRLSINQFHSTRWWEAKVEIYRRILQNASLLKEYWQDAYIEQFGETRSGVAYTSDEINKATAALHLDASSSGWILSDESMKRLRQISKGLFYTDTAAEEQYTRQFATDLGSFISDFEKLARQDLRQPSFAERIDTWMLKMEEPGQQRRHSAG